MNLAQMKDHKAELLRKAQTMLDAGQHTTPVYRSTLVDIETVTEDITMLESIERRTSGKPVAAPAPVTAPAIITETSEVRYKKVTDAACQFFRHAMSHVRKEQRDLLTTGDTTGGALNSQFFDSVFTEAAKYYGPVWNMVNRKDNTSGNPTKFPITSDVDRTFSLNSEGTTSSLSVNQTPAVFSNVTNTDTLISSVVYSIQEMEDFSSSVGGIEKWLTGIMGVAASRAWEQAVTLATTNDGSNAALPSSTTGGLLALAAQNVGVTQTAGTLSAGPTTAQLQALAGSVDRAYYQNGSFMTSPSVETFLRSQVDNTGRQLYCIDPDTGYLRIAGRLVVPNVAMPVLGTASKPLVIFGDMSKAWNVLNAGLKFKVVTYDGSAALTFDTNELIAYSRFGQSAGVSNAVASLISAAS
jgi:HK97 family phage major capsid protein